MPVERAEAQHHALLVRLHAIEAAGQPQCRDADGDQGSPRPPVKRPARAAAKQGANIGLQPGDELVEVGQRSHSTWAAWASAERPTRGRRPTARHRPAADAVLDRRRSPRAAARRSPRNSGRHSSEDMKMLFLCGLAGRDAAAPGHWMIGEP